MPDTQKALAVTRSFARPITAWPEMGEAITHYITRAAEKLRAQGLRARHIQVFLRTSPHASGPYYGKAVQRLLPQYTDFTPELIKHGRALLQEIFKAGYRYAKCGVILSDLVPSSQAGTQDLFAGNNEDMQCRIMQALDAVNRRYGKHTMYYAGAGRQRSWSMSRCILSPSYTTSWADLPVVKA